MFTLIIGTQLDTKMPLVDYIKCLVSIVALDAVVFIGCGF
jgi:hypothetical protein